MRTWIRRSSTITGLAFAALAAIATSAAAQEQVQAGFLGGASFSTLTGVDSISVRSSTGLALGFYVAVPVAKSLRVEPEILYVNKGAGLEDTEVTLNLNYIEIPVLLRYQFTENGGPFAYVGPYIGFNVTCNTSVDTVSVSCSDQSLQTNTTVGGTVGVGFQRGPWGFDVRYDYAFGNALKEENGKNSALMVLLRVAVH